MRNDTNISSYDPGGTRAPWDWYGDTTPTGASHPWRFAPIMSRYTCVLSGSEALYVKTANAGADADWIKVIIAQGNFTTTGTLTVGDLVVTT
jgi:hypothetical protein